MTAMTKVAQETRGQAPRAEPGARAAWSAETPRPAGLGGELVVRNTFIHYQEEEDAPCQPLRRSASAPSLPPPDGLVDDLHSLTVPERKQRLCKRGLPATGRKDELVEGLNALSGKPPPPPGHEWRTTLLLRNVPYLLTRDMLVEILDSHGCRGLYDLVYLPRDFKTNQTFGYGFINVLSPEIAVRLFRVFEGFNAWPTKSLKTCSVCWGNRQGLKSNVSAYRNLTVMKQSVPEAWKPALFSHGIQVPFPAPTKKRKPRGPAGACAARGP